MQEAFNPKNHHSIEDFNTYLQACLTESRASGVMNVAVMADQIAQQLAYWVPETAINIQDAVMSLSALQECSFSHGQVIHNPDNNLLVQLLLSEHGNDLTKLLVLEKISGRSESDCLAFAQVLTSRVAQARIEQLDEDDVMHQVDSKLREALEYKIGINSLGILSIGLAAVVGAGVGFSVPYALSAMMGVQSLPVISLMVGAAAMLVGAGIAYRLASSAAKHQQGLAREAMLKATFSNPMDLTDHATKLNPRKLEDCASYRPLGDGYELSSDAEQGLEDGLKAIGHSRDASAQTPFVDSPAINR